MPLLAPSIETFSTRICIPRPPYIYTTSFLFPCAALKPNSLPASCLSIHPLLLLQNPLLDMIRLFAEPILIRAPIPLPVSQHICSPSLNHTLHHTSRQLPNLFLIPRERGKKEPLTVLVICLCNPSSPSSCTACPFPILLKLSLIKNS